jgi:glycerol-3-phosphate acyltransferase PlsX
MITVALDAMGGDHAPRAEVEGAVLATREYADVRVILVGIEDKVRPELDRLRHKDLPIEVIAATDVVTMTDSPSHAFRRKKDSSLHVAARLVRDSKADALVSAGNTGAAMTVARFVLGTLPSVDRPALAWAFPNIKERVSVMLDVGANVDSKALHIEQFAVMGEIYYRALWGVKKPRIALLSIGEEDVKGNDLTREAAALLKQQTSLNFVGNVEGRDVFRGNVDVIICDGFIGNIALKLSEGLVEHIGGMLKRAIKSSIRSQIGYALSRKAFDAFRKRTDYAEYGGAPLLGVRGVTIIGHGRSNANAIKNAIRVAAELCRSGMNDKIEQELSAAAAVPARG